MSASVFYLFLQCVVLVEIYEGNPALSLQTGFLAI